MSTQLYSGYRALAWNRWLSHEIEKQQGIPGVEKAFRSMGERDVVSWNTVFQAYARTGHLHSACNLFYLMPKWSMFSWTAFLTAYASNGYIHKARELFDEMPPERSAVCWNALLTAYAQNGHISTAHSTFERMSLHTAVSWNALLQGNAQNGKVEEALDVFNSMPERVESSWNALLAAFARIGHLEDTVSTFQRMPSASLQAWNTLIRAYISHSECEARDLFDFMPQKDLISWNSLLAAYALNGHIETAEKTFRSMSQWSVASWTVMFTAYAHKGDATNATIIFEQMPCRDIVSWNAALSLYVHSELSKNALQTFKLMDLEGQPPDTSTYALIFDACAQLSEQGLNQGRLIHSVMIESGLFSKQQQQQQQLQVVATSLMAMYGNCGWIKESRRVFEDCRSMGLAVAARVWNAMLTAHAQNGDAAAALNMLQEMEADGVRPDSATLVVVLSACSRAGLLELGRECFMRLPADYDITVKPDHYACIDDLLARSGQSDTLNPKS